jgi:hypothetical protein
MAQYLSAAEGVRPDVMLAYLPHFLFPHYFSNTKASWGGGEYDSHTILEGERKQNSTAPNISNLGKFIEFLSPAKKPMFFEPALSLNASFRNIAQLTSTGLFELKRGEEVKKNSYNNMSIDRLSSRLDKIQQARFAEDSLNYAEAVNGGIADLLAHQGELGKAIELLDNTCFADKPRGCSSVSINNLAVYNIRNGNSLEAAELIARYLERRQPNTTLLQNLSLALASLSEQERQSVIAKVPFKLSKEP